MSLLKKLSIPVLSSILALAPLKSRALDGVVMNSITNEGIPDTIVKLYQGETLLDSARTDEEGYYKLSPNSVALEFNLPDNRSSEIKVFDIHGRFMYNLDQSWNGRTIPNLPSGAYIFLSENKAAAMPVMEGSLLSSIQDPLSQRVLSGKNASRTSGADEPYTLSVSDDGIEGQIGDYYDADIPLLSNVNALQSLTRDVELIPFYDMRDWDGDFLEYLKGTHSSIIWGDYPEHYPVNVDLDSVNCMRYIGQYTSVYLNAVRNALDKWNEMTGLNIFNYENVNVEGNDAQIRVDYSRDDGLPQFASEYVRDQDGRYRIESGVVYLRNDYGEYPAYVESTAKHELGHGTGWLYESPNQISIMYASGGSDITEDDGHTVNVITTLKNYTNKNFYLQE